MKKGLSFLLLVGLFFGCSTDSPKLVPMKIEKGAEQENLGQLDIFFKPMVDVLFIIDDSGSMGTHQQNLRDNVDLFVQKVAPNAILDFNFGVMTTDPNRHDLRGNPKVISRTLADFRTKLAERMKVGTFGPGTESVFDPLINGLSEPALSGANGGFIRDQAKLAVIFVTDAEDQSRRYDVDDAVQFVLDLKGDPKNVFGFGVLARSVDTNCQRDDFNTVPAKIEEFLSRFEGKTFSLCSPTFGSDMAEIGEIINRNTARTIYLNQLPVVETIRVMFGELQLPVDRVHGWSYNPDLNAIQLGTDLKLDGAEEDSELRVEFIPADR